MGEYVQGNWEAQDQTVIHQTEAGQRTVEFQQVWDANAQMYHLFWERDGVRHELMFQAAYIPHPAYYADGEPTEAGYLTLHDMLAIAASMR